MHYRREYSESLKRHIAAVQEFGTAKMGMSHRSLATHDSSKWSEEEFEPYARHFYGGGCDPDWMAIAWLHHIHYNPHHWNHWIYSGGWVPKGADCENGVLAMPTMYAMEMIADWHGAGYAYTGDWDISKWLAENMSRITLHTKTARFVREVLDMHGYADVIYTHSWAHELPPTPAARPQPPSSADDDRDRSDDDRPSQE